MYKIKKITYNEDLLSLKYFFEVMCGNSSDTFTYFKKRSYEVIKNHISTNLLFLDEKPIGYSHLDKEEDKIWFGICIAESQKGKGLGEKLIVKTLEDAKQNNLKEIILSVHKNNIIALKLYKKVGFSVYNEDSGSFFMKKDI